MSDNFNFDDPFDGDLNFDSDFDHDKKGSKLKSFAIGFLGGAKDALVGDTDAKLKTVKMVLPDSFNGTFQFINDTRFAYNELKQEIKRETASSMQDIQYLVGQKADSIKSKLPVGLSNKIDQFSQYDFTQWEEGGSPSSGDKPTMDQTTDQDVDDVVEATRAGSLMTATGLRSLGKEITDALVVTAGAQNATNQAVAVGVAKSNAYLKQMVDYQLKIQQRNDNMKINLLARIHLTNAKFYKFMEAANHRLIAEVKDVAKSSRMSDFQKMSMGDEVRKRIRGTFFDTMRSNAGGIMGLLNDRVGKYARQNGYSALNNLTSQLSMVGGMTDGISSTDMIQMLGSMVGGGAVDMLPRLLKGKKADELRARFAKAFPEMNKKIKDRYGRLDTVGHQASYGLNNLEGLFNTLSANYQGGSLFGDEEDAKTYQEYKASLPPGQKPVPEFVWKTQQWAKKTANKGLGVVLDNTYGDSRTRYNLKGRSYADGAEAHIYTRQTDRTINEIIPAWFSKVHLSLEKMRTGNANLQPETYDWTRGKFITAKGQKAMALREVYGSNTLGSAVYNAKSAVDVVDEKNTLSKNAKTELGYQLARKSDAGMGFSPYHLLNLEKDGVAPEIAAEIRAMAMENFGLTQDHIDRFQNGNDADRAKLLAVMTGKGAALANKALPYVQDIKRGIYDTNSNIDRLRNSGHYEALRDAGIIITKNGREEIDDEKMWKMFRQQQTDENFDKKLRQQQERGYDNAGGDTVNRPGAAPVNGEAGNTENNFGELNSNLSELTKALKSGVGTSGGGVNHVPAITQISTQLDQLIGIQTSHTDLFQKILEKQPTIIRRSKREQAEEEKGKKSLMDRIKGFSPRNLFNKGVETLLNNEPLILGGLLGGLGAYALHDPKAAALVGAGGLAMAGYSKLRSMNNARFADTEDLYENPDDAEPLLSGERLKRGDYYDSATRAVLKTWNDVTSAVVDKVGNIIASARQLAQKLFGADGRARLLKGLNKVRELGMKMFNALDPFGRASKLGNAIKQRFYQMDVFREGDKSPVLLGKKMGKGFYFKLDSSGKPVEIKGWNEIDGAVYDQNGDCIVTQDDFDRGLKTSMGVSINKLGDLTKRAGIFGLDLLGKAKDSALVGGRKLYDKTANMVKADYTPITTSIDRIYYLLCKQFGIEPEELDLVDKIDAVKVMRDHVQKKPEDTDDTRLNSLEDERRKAKEKKAEQVQDAIINIGDSLGGINNRKEEKKKPKGLLGLLFSGVGMVKGLVEKIFGKTLMNGFGTLFKFAGMGLKSLPIIGTGIAKLASFFTGGGSAGGVEDLINSGADDVDTGGDPREERKKRKERDRKKKENRQRRERQRADRLRGGGGTDAELERDLRNQGRRNRVRRGRRFGGLKQGLKNFGGSFNPRTAILKAGLLYAGGQAASELMDNDTIGTVGNVMAGYSVASSVAAAAGVDIGVGALASAAGTGLAAVGSAAATALASPVVLAGLAVAGVGLAGYGIYKWYTKGKYRQVDIRFAQYGLEDPDCDLGKKIFQMEQVLTKYVVINNGRASFSTDTPIQQIFNMLQTGTDGKTSGMVGDVFSWFNGRFKPVYLTYMSCLDTLRIKSLEEFDKLTDKRAYDIAYQASQAIGGIQPGPYQVTPNIDPHDKLMGQTETVATVGKYLEELKKYTDKGDNTAKVKDVAIKVESKDALEKEKGELQEKLKNTSFLGLNGTTGILEQRRAKSRIEEIDDEVGKLNDAYGAGKVAGSVDIRDLIPDNGILDPFTLIRMNAYGLSLSFGKEYGNDLFPAWKFQAMAHLERRVEGLIRIIGKDARFIGKTGELFHEFKAAFRVKDNKADDWCLWFRDRFLPVLMNYYRLYNGYGQGAPGSGWKNLTATAKYQIALGIIDTRNITPKKTFIPIWSIKTSPFTDGFSVPKLDEVDKLLKTLQELSNKAKLRNPTLEAQNTSTRSGIAQTTAHAVGGAATDKLAADSGNPQTREQLAQDAGYALPAMDYKQISGNTDTSKIDLSGVKPSANGNDTGVSVPRNSAEQLIIKEMIAAGMTDPRLIAEALALTNYESQGYSKTTENMRYRDPARLMELFRNVTNMTTAQQLVQAGPQAIANYVYGGGKGASLGNIQADDGWNFRGRGFIQLTGRANYRKFGQMIGVDLEKNPQLASTDPRVMAKLAVAFIKDNKQLQSIVKNNNFGYAARGLNGGNALPGMERRFSMYKDYLTKLTNGSLKPDGEADKSAAGAPGDLAAQGRAATEAATGGVDQANPAAPKPTGNSYVDTGTDEVSIPRNPSVGGNGSGLPPMSAYGLGGGDQSGAGAGFQRVADATSTASGTRTQDYKGLKVKSAETTAGGPVHPGIVRVGQEIQARVQDFIRFTALNDAYHHKANPRSKHTQGLALDFTVTGGAGTSDAAIGVVAGIMRNAGMTSQEYKIINEYKVRTAATSGGHVHFNFASDAAASKYLRAVGEATSAEMGRVETEAATNPQPTAPEDAGAVENASSPANTPANTPASPAAPAATTPTQTPAAPATPAAQPAPTPAAPAADQALDPKVLASAVAAGSGTMEELLRELIKAVNSQGNKGPSVVPN